MSIQAIRWRVWCGDERWCVFGQVTGCRAWRPGAVSTSPPAAELS